MILVDTSVLVDHLRAGVPALSALLEDGQVLVHPWVIGELACGTLRRRAEILALLGNLPPTPVATHDEAMVFIETHSLIGRGIGYVDVHLLASVRLQDGALLWTRDRSLAAVAADLNVSSPHL